jgi:hypothetical protein
MHLSRLSLLPALLVALAACGGDDGVSVNTRPPLGGVRFINAVADGGPVDIRMIDQVEWSASSVNGTNIGLAFRAGTIHWPTEAKARHIRVFPTDTANFAVATTVLHDTTITIEADKNVTLMLVGSRAAGGKVSFIRIDDSVSPTPSQVAVRLVNASNSAQVPATAAGYITSDTTSALPGTATFGSVGPLTASAYVMRAPSAATVFFRATPAGNTTTVWNSVVPAGAPQDGLIGVTAGANGPGSALSAFVFPRSVAGTAAPQSAAFQRPNIVFFVDLIPKPPV